MRSLISGMALAAGLALFASAASAQTVYIVRHAEKASDTERDPVLSGAGIARAEALAALFSEGTPDLIVVSPLQRTQLTAAPALEASGAFMVVSPLDDGVEAHVETIRQGVWALSEDTVVLIVGHSNTVPLIARALGYETLDMPECEYDRLIRLERRRGEVSGETRLFGVSTTC
ncbi:MAG: phosphoglycerate mutase family protein [Brevundimonas sp.]|uniref:SixA phosphatase family protein n=1 Tax=Brevundimonas sp. TaxID=1871086 RepID=UPI00273456FF|nr:phosphoglycerate mutase family protein [Brevundimonas sp.]MDP3378138.1 phosphoglycerate mutase family protein [Brevundimonas sp.]